MIHISLIFKSQAKLLFLFCVGVLISSSVFCQVTYIDKRKPALFTQLLSGPTGSDYYESPDAAWAAYTSWIKETIKAPYEYILTNFRSCAPGAGQYGYYWGYPASWCHDYKILINGIIDREGTTGVVSVAEGCPDGYRMVNSLPLNSGGNGVNPYIFERRCEKEIVTPHPQSCGVGNPIDLQDQSKSQVMVDYIDPHGLMNFVRTYDSKSGGFTHNFSYDFMPPTKGAIGTVKAQIVAMWDSTLGKTVTRNVYTSRLNDDGLTTYYVMPTGSRYEFSWGGSSGMSLNQYNTDQLRAATFADGPGWLLKRVGEHRFLSFNSAGQLTAITSAQGQKLSLEYSAAAIPSVAPAEGYMISATDTSGRKLMFGYTDGGQLSNLTDPNGQVIYYNHAAMLEGKLNSLARVTKPISVIYQDGSAVQYLWNESAYATGFGNGLNLLTGLVDENGVRFAIFRYVDEKAISTEHAVGIEKYTVTDGRSNGVGVVSVVDPLNTKMDLQYGLIGGYSRLKGRNQQAGAGCNASSSAVDYDSNGNLASADDFNGNRTCYSNDLTRNLAVVQVEGLAKTVTCSSVTATAASLPVGSRKTSTQWHPGWSLETKQAKPGSIVTWVYNGQPDPFNAGRKAYCVKDLVSGASTAALLPDGSPIAVLCKRVEQGTTDKNGSQGFSATLDNSKREENWTYTQYGKVLTYDGSRTDVSDVTRYAYYTADDTATPINYRKGDLKSVTDPLGQVTTYNQYNLSGRPLQVTDPNNVITQYTYDLRQRLKTVAVQVSGTTYDTTTLNYWPTGQLKQVLFPDSSTINYGYDDAHRLTAVYDSVGNRIDYVLDAAGNVKNAETREAWTTTNVLRTKMNQVMDALGRVQQTTGGLR